MVSMVPFAVEARTACLVIHVSGLAAHTRNLRSTPAVSLMVMRAEVAGEPVHALPRVTFDGRAELLDIANPISQSCRAAYLARFPEAAPMTELGDFMFVAIHPTGAREVAGFGAARFLDSQQLVKLLRSLAEGG